jgi:NADPH:quinone reductase-like Zn-dependent oxidoreductase
MRAVIAKERGARGVISDVPIPAPNSDELLVRVTAVSINPVDWKSVERDGREFPAVMGQDFAGVVVQTGNGVTGFRPNDRVFGIARNRGAFAEFTVVPQDEREQPVAALPDAVDDVNAAAVPTAGLTALLAIETLKVQPGEALLICGVSGGVGSIAAQIALARGIRVIGTASSKSEQFVRSLGDVEFVPYDLEEPTSAALFRSEDGVDGVLDLVDGPDHVRVMADAIKPGGAIVSTIGALDEEWFAERKITATNLALPQSPRSSAQGLLELAGMIERGEISVKIAEEESSLDDVPSALEKSREGKVNGKIVVRVTSSNGA